MRDPYPRLLLPLLPRAHRHAPILRTELVDTSQVFAHVPRLAPQAVRHLELSSTVTAYRKLGVHWVNQFVQHGTLINRLLRRRHPEYRRMRSRAGMQYLVQRTYVQERFHWTALLFFLLSSLYGITHGFLGWALLIAITNVVYNLYTIWLQQYIRVRLNRSRSNLRPVTAR